MNNYIEIQIPVAEQWQKDMLIAHLFELGYDGFEEERLLLKAYIEEPVYNEAALQQVLFPLTLSFSKSAIANRNWNAEWESAFEPVIVDDFCVIRAGFHAPVNTVTHEIIITPKMSFGTGHHATTYMMVEAMRELDLRDKKVFDFGTGTGVLAILASRMGAKEVTAIDNDDWSIENAAENFQGNNCPGIILRKAESMQQESCFDIILANINRNVIVAQMSIFKQHLTKNGVVLLSGLLKTDEEKVLETAGANGLVLGGRREKNDWICLIMNNL
jgi:ribosomal protein L11 methyltransferase